MNLEKIKSLGERVPTWALALLAAIVYSALVYYTIYDYRNPDFFFHWGLSKQMLDEGGYVRAIPRAEDMNWATHFVDKEFLYHLLTAPALWLGGEHGLIFLARALGLIAYLTFFFVSFRFTGSRWWAFGLTLIAISDNYLFFRLSILRPHTLSIIIYLLLIYVIKQGRPVLLGIMSFLYPLAYHTLYVPIFLFGLFFLFLPERRKMLSIAFGCLFLGVALHPYEGYLDFSFHIVNMALFPNALAELPVEFLRRPLSQTWHWLVAAIGLVAGLIAFLRTTDRVTLRQSYSQRFLVAFSILALVWYGLSFKQPRAMEYGYFPLLLGFALNLVCLRLKWPIQALVVLILAICHFSIGTYTQRIPQHHSIPHALLEQVQPGEKVLNTVWNYGGDVYALSEHARFVDLLNPYALAEEAPLKSDLRSKLALGLLLDPMIAVQAFKADYVLVLGWHSIAQLSLDPRFERVYPVELPSMDRSPPHTLFRVRKDPPGRFLNEIHSSTQKHQTQMVPPENGYPSVIFLQAKTCEDYFIPREALGKTDWIVFGGAADFEVPGAPSINLLGENGIFTWAFDVSALKRGVSFRSCKREVHHSGAFAVSLWTQIELEEYCAHGAPFPDRILGVGAMPGNLCRLAKIK